MHLCLEEVQEAAMQRNQFTTCLTPESHSVALNKQLSQQEAYILVLNWRTHKTQLFRACFILEMCL